MKIVWKASLLNNTPAFSVCVLCRLVPGIGFITISRGKWRLLEKTTGENILSRMKVRFMVLSLTPPSLPLYSEWVLGKCAEDRGLRALWSVGNLLVEGRQRQSHIEGVQDQEQSTDLALQTTEEIWTWQGGVIYKHTHQLFPLGKCGARQRGHLRNVPDPYGLGE